MAVEHERLIELPNWILKVIEETVTSHCAKRGKSIREVQGLTEFACDVAQQLLQVLEQKGLIALKEIEAGSPCSEEKEETVM